MKTILSLLILLYLTACSSQYGRYQQKHDSTPSRIPMQSELKDAIPKYEPYSKVNSRPYTVRDKNYTVMKSAKGFTQTGIASWYGSKFHGHQTANGEIYNMYSMSAAHKSLPLPTYLKVTNLANNKSVIVRVNDRGPFHEDRIIDLSYSAAYKLDMLKTGTTQVKISAITDFTKQPHISTKKAKSVPVKTPIKSAKEIPNQKSVQAPKNKYLPHTFIEVMKTNNKILAEKTSEALTILNQTKTTSIPYGEEYRVMMGPFKSDEDLNHILNRLKETGYPEAYKKLILSR